MTEKQKNCLIRIQDLIVEINNTVKDEGLESEFLSVLAVGFVDMTTAYEDEEGDERANMSLMSSFSVTDEDELDDMLSYCLEAYRIERDEQNNQPEDITEMEYIDYWIRFANGKGGIN